MVLFAHITDTHLGHRNFKMDEREEDFEKVFEQAVEICIKKKVDFIIHSGDLFDNANPSTKTFVFAVKQLQKLKENNIPLFVVPGSHDIGVNGTYITVLDQVGLLKNLAAKKYYETLTEGVKLKGEICKGCFISGVPGRKENVKKMYESLRPDLNNSLFNIFLFHHTTTNISSLFGDIAVSSLPSGFDYYAGGHWHQFNVEGNIIFPGSTEYNDTSDMEAYYEKNLKKGFFLVKVDGKKFEKEFVPLDARQVIIKKINCNRLSPENVVENFKKITEPVKNEPILLLKLEGRLNNGNKVEINRQEIMETAKKNGYLNCKIITNDLLDPLEEEKISVSGKTLEELEKNYLKSKKYSEPDMELAFLLMDSLGEKLTPAELEKNCEKIIKKLEDE